MRISEHFGESVEATRDDRMDALGGTHSGDPWVSLTLRPDAARSLAIVLAAERHDAGWQMDARALEEAADWAEGVDEDAEEDQRPGLRIVVVNKR